MTTSMSVACICCVHLLPPLLCQQQCISLTFRLCLSLSLRLSLCFRLRHRLSLILSLILSLRLRLSPSGAITLNPTPSVASLTVPHSLARPAVAATAVLAACLPPPCLRARVQAMSESEAMALKAELEGAGQAKYTPCNSSSDTAFTLTRGMVAIAKEKKRLQVRGERRKQQEECKETWMQANTGKHGGSMDLERGDGNRQ